jgi:hypothetical protein
MVPDFLQFTAFFLLAVALLKIGSSYALHHGHSTLGNGLGWFVPGIA